jgi:hypothetical protein
MSRRWVATFLVLGSAATGALAIRHCAAPAPDPAGTAPPSVCGLFALSNSTRPLPAWVHTHADLTGVSLRAGWRQLQPEEDEFQPVFDQEIARAHEAGKQVSLSVDPGDDTPEWVYTAGAHPFVFQEDNPFRRQHGQTVQVPVPWDAVFLQKWTAFIQALGTQYAGNETVVLVHMVGATRSGGEMHLPRSKEARAAWARLGYTPDKLVAAWKPIIDAYATAFPTQALALDVAIPITDDGAADRIVAYAFEKLGGRLHVQHNALSARTVPTWKVQRLVRAYQGKATIGFQLLCPVTPRGRFNDEGRRFGGPLAEAFRIGQEAGASYYEIYPIDLDNKELAQVLHEIAEQLRK